MNAGEQLGAKPDRRDLLLIYGAALLRSTATGVISVLLGVYLARAGSVDVAALGW